MHPNPKRRNTGRLAQVLGLVNPNMVRPTSRNIAIRQKGFDAPIEAAHVLPVAFVVGLGEDGVDGFRYWWR